MVGLLEWKDKEAFESFPKKDRRDLELLKVLRDRGVPADHVRYLQDREATTGRIESELPRFLSRAMPGDTVFLYYEGHGYKDDDDKAYLASYDVDDAQNPGWAVDKVPAAIERYFKGSNAIIALDNCYSGSMVKAVNAARRRVAYAVLASSSATQSSTGNWTFTEAIISAFRGDPVSDDNGDGVVTFAELRDNAEADMLFGEEQVAAFTFTGGFSPQTVIGPASRSRDPRVGERVEAYSVDDWYRGYIVDAASGKYRIHYYGYDVDEDEWVRPNMIRVPRATSQFRIGDPVEVEYKRKWYPAHIVNIRGGSHFVSYDDYDVDDNEWVSTKRIRRRR